MPELSQKLDLTGFRVKRISYNNFFLFPLIAGMRLLRPYNPGLKSPHLSDDADAYQVEMEPIPEPANTVLHGVYWLEAALLEWVDLVGWLEAELVERINLPFGTSVLCIAEK